MPLGLFPALLAVAIVVTMGSAYYLIIHARGIALLFNRSGNDVAPGPGRGPGPGRARLFAAMCLFAIGALMSILIVTQYGAEPVEQAIDSHPGEVQRP